MAHPDNAWLKRRGGGGRTCEGGALNGGDAVVGHEEVLLRSSRHQVPIIALTQCHNASGAVEGNLPSHEDVRIPAVIERAAREPHVIAVLSEGRELAPMISICLFVGILRGEPNHFRSFFVGTEVKNQKGNK